MKKLYFLFLFCLMMLMGYSQTGKTIKGIVKDSAGVVLPNATVKLFAQNVWRDTLAVVADEGGNFLFSSVRAADFKLLVSFAGFADYTRIYHYPESDTVIDVGEITLSSSARMLEEVIIRADRTVTIKEDTIEFKADSFKLRSDADVEALLKKLPGIQVDAAGNITAYGKSVSKIRVNGKDFFSGDIKTATKELPANIVDAVQVIDDYGDQAAFTGIKEGDPDKIINLQIKKDKNHGYFGRGQAGIGTDDRYTVNGSLNHFNNSRQLSVLANFNNTNTSTFSLPGRGGSGGFMRGGMPDNGTMNTMTTIMNNGDGAFLQSGQVSNDGISRINSLGVNLRDDIGKDLSVYGSYNFTDRQTKTFSNTEQTNVFSNGNVVNYNNSSKTDNSTGHRAFLNAEWKIDSFNQIKFSPSFTYNSSNSSTLSNFNFNNSNGGKLNEGSSSGRSKYTQPNFNATLLYNHRFAKPGRLLSANLTGGYNATDQHDDETNNSTYYTPNGTNINRQRQLITQDNTNPSANVRLSYIEPLGRKKSVEFNFTHSYSLQKNDRITELFNGSYITVIDSLSNVFENKFSYQRYGVNYRFNEKKFNYSIGVAAQANQMNGESFRNKGSYGNNTFNWFPQGRFTYNFSRTKSFSLNYTSAITAPASSQLQPVFDYSDPQYPVIGNPDLSPEFKSTFSARYNNFDFMSGNMLFSNISFSFTRDKVVTNSINRSGGNGLAIQETRYVNADGYFNAFGFYNFSKPFQNRKYTLTFNGNLSYTNDVSFINSQENTGRNFTGSQGLNVDIRLSDWLEVGAGGSFTYNKINYTLTPQAATEVRTYSINSNGKIYLPGKFVLNYDLSKTINSGYGVSANPFIVNGYLEKQFAKNNGFSLRLQAYDLLNQNTSITRNVSANSITDTRTNRLGRYFMLSINVRLQKFKGRQPANQFPPLPPLPEGGLPPRF